MMHDLPTGVLHYLYTFLDLQSMAKLETTCSIARAVGMDRSDLHLFIDDTVDILSSKSFFLWVQKRAHQFASVKLAVKDGQTNQLVAAHLGSILEKAVNLKSVCTIYTDDASWSLPLFLTTMARESPPGLQSLALGMGGIPQGYMRFMGAFNKSLKALQVYFPESSRLDDFLKLSLPVLEDLTLCGDGCVAIPKHPMKLPSLRNVTLHGLIIATVPFELENTLVSLSLVLTSFLPVLPKDVMTISDVMTVFHCDFPSCIDVSKLHKLHLILGNNRHGNWRRLPPSISFPSLRVLSASQTDIRLTPEQIPYVSSIVIDPVAQDTVA